MAGASWLLAPTSWGGTAKAAKEDSAEREGGKQEIYCWGHFDIEGGVAGLYPRQVGEVIKRKPENTLVKKGEVLLQLDDTLAQLKVKEAEAGVHAAEQQVAEANLLGEQYELQKTQQQALIDAIKFERKKVEEEKEKNLQALNPGAAQTKTIENYYKAALDELTEKQKAEEAKRELIDFQIKKVAAIKIAQAEADLRIKQNLVKQATDLLRFYQILAPEDGMVLRTYVREGEMLGSNPKSQAIDFLPTGPGHPMIVRAEVLQEWGRYVKVGQAVEIVDDTYNGPKWDGEVMKLSKWYAMTRSAVIEPLRYNDVRTLECLIRITSTKDNPNTMYIGQRVRAKIKA
jgi:multidrug resistance efflux pump